MSHDARDFSEPRDGFAELRWHDSRERITARFAGRTRETPSYEGRDPRTGERVFVGGGIAITAPEGPAGLQMSMGVDFDDRGITEITISAAPIADATSWGEAEWAHFNELAAGALRELARRLRLENLSLDLQEQTWSVDGIQIVLAIDTGPGDFMLFLRRPDAIPAS
jgi:hypothetical protein